MGILALLSDLLDTAASIKTKKRKQFRTVDVRVKLDCEGCERRVRNAMKSMKGVKKVEVERKNHRVSVSGFVDPKKVLERVRRSTGRKAEPWPFTPHFLSVAPYAPGAYDKKAPAGLVRNIEFPNPPMPYHEVYSNTAAFFSDDNPHACSIM